MSRTIFGKHLVPIAAFALLLAACGGGSATAPATPSEAAPPTVAEATAAPSSAGAAPATAAAQATTEPAATTAPAPTQPPAATEAPAASTAASACDNAYYPLRQGATWSYVISGTDAYTQTVTKTEAASAEVSIQTHNISASNEITCADDGLHFGSLPTLSNQAGTFNAELKTETAEGAYLLPADKLVPGATWDTHYVVKGKITVSNQQVEVTDDVKLHFEVVGTEKVTVPAGTFDALKINQQMTLAIQMQNAPANLPPTTLDQVVWFARDVGMVKNTVVSRGASQLTTELKSYNIP